MFEELHLARLENERTRREIEALRLAVGVHVISRKQAADILGCHTKTVKRYEDRGRLEQAHVNRPGAHYFLDDILKLQNAA